MRVGFYQYSPVSSVTENVVRLSDRLSQESEALIVLPELFLMDGSDPVALDCSALHASLAPLLSLTGRQKLSLVGSLAVAEGRNTFNRLIYLDSGRIAGKYDKKRLFRGEASVFGRGNEGIGIFHHRGRRFAGQVCFDLLDPIPVAKAAQALAIDLLAVSAAASVDYLWTLAKARSLENQIVTVLSNRCGKDSDGILYLGRSCVFLPDGEAVEAEGGDDLRIVDIPEEDLQVYADQRRELLRM